jgi:hypothetical protein
MTGLALLRAEASKPPASAFVVRAPQIRTIASATIHSSGATSPPAECGTDVARVRGVPLSTQSPSLTHLDGRVVLLVPARGRSL